MRASLVGVGGGHRDVERRAEDVGAPPCCTGGLSCLLTTLHAIACRIVMFDIIFDTFLMFTIV